MATFTPNYNLRKPDASDLVDEDADLNDNYDIIDSEIKDRADEINQLELDARGLRQMLIYTANDSFTKATYPWLKAILVKVQGGGGAGGGCGATNPSVGAGGGAGGYAELLIPVASLAAAETITIGAAGTGGTGVGGNGGNSSFGAHAVGNGGAGGGTSATANSSANAGVGGTGTAAGGLTIQGEKGEPGYNLTSPVIHTGRGGNSHLGHGGTANHDVNAAASLVAGEAGLNYGGGGSGALNATGAGSANGGNGGAGIIIVELLG